MKILLCVLIALQLVIADKSRYDNYRVYKIQIENAAQLDAMKYLADTSDSVIFIIIIINYLRTRFNFVCEIHSSIFGRIRAILVGMS